MSGDNSLLSLYKKPALISPKSLQKISVLYAAEHAPVTKQQSKTDPKYGGYPEYHAEIYQKLHQLGLDVRPVNKVSILINAIPQNDFIFSLFNRIGFDGGEVFVSALCEYHAVPFLGGPTHLRAVAEDKHLAKLIARESGLLTPSWRAYRTGEIPDDEPPFHGPFIVKPRFGAGSHNISADNTVETWSEVKSKIRELNDLNVSALLEAYIDGWNLTVPVLGGKHPYVLPSVKSHVSEDNQIITRKHKLYQENHMWFEVVDPEPEWARKARSIGQLLNNINPYDYLRIDYRIDKKTLEPLFLEFNICCDIGSAGSLMASARHTGLSHLEVLAHVVSYSWQRQTKPATGDSAKSGKA